MTPVRPMTIWELQELQNSSKPLGNLLKAWKPSKSMQQAKTCSTFSPLLTMHESSQNAKKCNLELLK
jgi:hypothetical protein